MSAVSNHYTASAALLRDQYGLVGFDQVHEAILDDLPKAPSRVADIGAGSGRDAKGLSDRGHAVTAVEPSAAMRRHASLMDNRSNIRWVDDQLPDLARLKASGDRFAFILCSAVLMHVAEKDLARSFESLSGLMTPAGRLAISLRAPRGGDAPGVYVEHSVDSVLAAALPAGLSLIRTGAAADLLSRPDIAWSWFVFEKPGSS